MSFHSRLPSFRFSVQSDELAVREALKKLLDGLRPLDLDVEEAGTVELVMAEALNNIVEHAYPEGEPSGPINITCTHADDGLHLTVVDRGHGMPDGRTPLGQAANLNVDFSDLPEGGFGWFLIKDLAKDVTYKRIDPENFLSLRLAVAMP
ncbi:MAG: ATP-binding protein [Pseudomonadota bacterium]